LCFDENASILTYVVGKFDRQSLVIYSREESPGSIGQDAG